MSESVQKRPSELSEEVNSSILASNHNCDRTVGVPSVDITHWVRKPRQDGSKPCGIILRFISQQCRDAIRKGCQEQHFPSELGTEFTEDLPKEDRENQYKMWLVTTWGGEIGLLCRRKRIQKCIRNAPLGMSDCSTLNRPQVWCSLVSQGHSKYRIYLGCIQRPIEKPFPHYLNFMLLLLSNY